jgi:hypothetical protein
MRNSESFVDAKTCFSPAMRQKSAKTHDILAFLTQTGYIGDSRQASLLIGKDHTIQRMRKGNCYAVLHELRKRTTG